MDELSRAFKTYLEKYPIRNPLVVVEEEDGKAVLLYKKDLGRFERWLQRRLGGPEVIRRPLDEMGTAIWSMCDGGHTGLKICRKMDRKFKDEIEPVVPRVVGFLRTLENRNLILVTPNPEKLADLITPTANGDGEKNDKEKE